MIDNLVDGEEEEEGGLVQADDDMMSERRKQFDCGRQPFAKIWW